MDKTSLSQSYLSDKDASILERQNELNRLLPALKIGEYDTVVESIAGRGLGLNLRVRDGSIIFGGYKTFEDGFKCPAALIKSIHAEGDVFIAVNGVSLVGLSFKDAFTTLQANVGEGNKFVFLRFRGSATANTSTVSTQPSVVQPRSTNAGITTTVRPRPIILDKSGQPHREVVPSTDTKSHDGSASTAILPSRSMPYKNRTLAWYGHTRMPCPRPSIVPRPDAMEETLLEESVPPTSSQVNSNVKPASASHLGEQEQLQAGSGEMVKAPQTGVGRPPSIVEPATFASDHPASSESAGTSFGSNRTGTVFLDKQNEQSKAMLPNEKHDSSSSTFAISSVAQLPQNVYLQPSFNAMGYASAYNDMTAFAHHSYHRAVPATTLPMKESHSTPRNAAILQAKQPALPTKSSSVQQMPTQQSSFASANSSFQQFGSSPISNASSAQNTTVLEATNDGKPLPTSDSFTPDPPTDHQPRKRLFAFKSILEGETRSLNASSIISCKVLEGKGEEGYKRLHVKRAALAYATPLDEIDELMEAKKQQTTRNRNGPRGPRRSAEPRTPPHAATSPKKRSKPRSLMVGSRSGRAPTLVYEGPPLKALFGGWPDGWSQKTFQRHGSTSRDSYFYGPGSDHRFRSLIEVLRFLGR